MTTEKTGGNSRPAPAKMVTTNTGRILRITPEELAAILQGLDVREELCLPGGLVWIASGGRRPPPDAAEEGASS